MLNKLKLWLAVGICLSATSMAVAAPIYRHHSPPIQRWQINPIPRWEMMAAADNRRYAECFARMQPGDMAIFIQDRFYRESVGDPFWKGECPNGEPIF